MNIAFILRAGETSNGRIYTMHAFKFDAIECATAQQLFKLRSVNNGAHLNQEIGGSC